MKLRKNTRLWLKALRSGKYRQRKRTLGGIDNDGKRSFCILGVACELYRKSHPKFCRYKITDEDGNQIFVYGKLRYESELPPKVFKWLKLKDKKAEDSIAIKNDCTFMSFENLANLLESKYKYFFLTK